LTWVTPGELTTVGRRLGLLHRRVDTIGHEVERGPAGHRHGLAGAMRQHEHGRVIRRFLAPPTQVGMPSRAQAAVVSPNAPAIVPQDWLEGCYAATWPPWTAPRRSSVRQQLGVQMRGPDDLFNGVQAVFRAPLWPLLGDVRYGMYYVRTPDAPGTFLPAGRDDRWVYGLHSATEPPAGLDETRCTELIAGLGTARLVRRRSATRPRRGADCLRGRAPARRRAQRHPVH
jgi:hypothetical protein